MGISRRPNIDWFGHKNEDRVLSAEESAAMIRAAFAGTLPEPTPEQVREEFEHRLRNGL